MEIPIDYPKIIYKYRNWKDQFQKDVLEKNHLFLTAPNYFNDPFDCRIPKNFLSLDTNEKIEEYANSFIRRQSENIIIMGKNVEEEKKKLIIDLTENLLDYHEGNAKYFYSQQDIHYGILSVTTKWDSILMWSHYGDYHRGVCYGFWEEKLRESGMFGKGGPVNYTHDYPDINPLDDRTMEIGFTETHTKAKDWKYEDEYRLFCLMFPGMPNDEDRVRKIPDDFFAEITLGISIPSDHKKEIINLAKQKGIKIFQAKKVQQKFEIDREEI